MRKMQGFTLIELMIVIAILAILLAIAIPAYQDYTVRAKVSEGINLASAVKLAVSETYQSEGTLPGNNGAAGVAASNEIIGNNVSDVAVGANGLITITYSADPKITGDAVVFSPTTGGGSIQWTCGVLPGTTVESRFLPATCRQ